MKLSSTMKHVTIPPRTDSAASVCKTKEGMILLTHNMLRSPMKAATQKLPLRIEIGAAAEEGAAVVEKERDYNEEFLRNTLPKLDWAGLLLACESLGLLGLPARIEEFSPDDETAMKLLHKILFEVHVIRGALLDTETGRKFPINNGIPNMLLNQDEI